MVQGPVLIGAGYVCGVVYLVGYLKAFNIGIAEVPIRNVDLLFHGGRVVFAFVLPTWIGFITHEFSPKRCVRFLISTGAFVLALLMWLYIVATARLPIKDALYFGAPCFLGACYLINAFDPFGVVPAKKTQLGILSLLAIFLAMFSFAVGHSEAQAKRNAQPTVRLLAAPGSLTDLKGAGLVFSDKDHPLLSAPVALVYPGEKGEFVYLGNGNTGKVVCLKYDSFAAVQRDAPPMQQ